MAIPAWAAPAKDQGLAAADDAANRGDIIVNARRVDERLQNVPIAMTVFSQEQLDNCDITSGADLATYTPSLSALPARRQAKAAGLFL